jgi:group I intron endonuclease
MTFNYKENLFDFKKSGIYKISCIKKEKHYIGESENITARLCAHKNKLRRNIHENNELQSDFNQYGEKCFLFEKLIFGNGIDKENRLKLETLILLTLKPQNRYNIYINWKKRDEYLNAFFNKKHTDEAQKAQSISKKNKSSPFKDKKHNNEIKKMLSKINSNKTTIERRKPVIIDCIYYESISEASEKTRLNRRLIRERCHDKTRFENFKWG